MAKAELHFLGQVRELSYIETEYYKHYLKDGMPTSIPLGGYLFLGFPTHYSDNIFEERITTINYEVYPMGYPMDKGEIIFYDASEDIVKRWKVADTIIKEVRTVFYAEGEDPMMTHLIFSPAIQNYGFLHLKSWNISYVEPEPYKSPVVAEEKIDFQIQIKRKTNKNTFVPLGVPAYSGTKENEFIEFEIEVSQNAIDSFIIEIEQGGTTIYTVNSGTNGLPKTYGVGKHIFKWDGFDKNGIYDSTSFLNGKLKAIVKGKFNGKEKKADTGEFSFEYKEVKWVDTKIDKNTNRIDITLRVNLKDGGAKGIDCYEKDTDPDPKLRIPVKVCPWDKIPKSRIKYYGKTPIKTRAKSFTDLEQLAIDGLNYHWGRNQNHFIAKNASINGTQYEVYVNTINTKVDAMDDVSLVFNTNNSWMRSGNPGTVEDPISFVGNIVSREAICYNVGYIKYSDDWGYNNLNGENIEFKDTSAHEIGHTILKAYGGTFYSYGHKGSVNTVTQSRKPSAPKIPIKGEIDIMPYYNNNSLGNEYSQKDYHKRRVASKKDVLSLVWLTKIELK